jgi:hypothetical protein
MRNRSCRSIDDNLFGGAGICFRGISSEDQGVLRQFVKRELKKLDLEE